MYTFPIHQHTITLICKTRANQRQGSQSPEYTSTFGTNSVRIYLTVHKRVAKIFTIFINLHGYFFNVTHSLTHLLTCWPREEWRDRFYLNTSFTGAEINVAYLSEFTTPHHRNNEKQSAFFVLTSFFNHSSLIWWSSSPSRFLITQNNLWTQSICKLDFE